jgi:hypothetical protein
MMPRYALTAGNRDFSARIRVNDLPAIDLRFGMERAGRTINEFVIDGENSITLQVNESRPDSGDSLLVALSADNSPVCLLGYPTFESTGELPFFDEDVFEPPDPVGERRWQRGAPLELKGETRDSLIDFLRRTEAALRSGPLAVAMGLCESRTIERAKAYGLPAAEELAKERAHFEGVSRLGSWFPIDYEGLSFEAGGAKRVVFVTTPDGGEPLRYMPDGEGRFLSFPLAAALIDGAWELVF